MSSSLARRLRRLEVRVPEEATWPMWVWILVNVREQEQITVGPGERLVEDWYRDDNGVVSARLRVTADPQDEGRRCEPNGYLADVIRELHSACVHRAEGRGVCMKCVDFRTNTVLPGVEIDGDEPRV